jgi:hypothetical protein
MVPRRADVGRSDAFVPERWTVLLADFEEVASSHPHITPMVDIVRSVLDCRGAGRLAARMSGYELVVVPVPVPDPPMPLVRVRAPGVMPGFPVPSGHVLITHESGVGRDDSISRPPEEAVALFWRFMIEKYGVHPARTRS